MAIQKYQRYLLEYEAPQKIGNPVAFTEDTVVLESGEEIGCDVIIWCTGYHSGVDDLKFEKNDKPFEPDMDKRLFHHIILSDFPIVASAGHFSTTAGPLRGVSAAEYVIYHTCVRKKLSQRYMKWSASW